MIVWRSVWLCMFFCGAIVLPGAAAPENWVATWATSAMSAGERAVQQVKSGLDGHTIRQIVPLTVGGTALRIRLSNRKGTGPIRLDDIYIGIPLNAPALTAGSTRAVTFNTKNSIMIPQGAEAISDPLPLVLGNMQDVAVSFHVTLQKGAPSVGASGVQSYIAAGRMSTKVDAVGFSALGGAILLSAVDVVAAERVRGAVVAFGDSVTAGGRTSWPGVLASRLAQHTGPTLAVLNYGIAGNRLLYDSACWGDGGLARLEEALSQSGVKALIFAGLGGNDIRLQDRPGDPSVSATPDSRFIGCYGSHDLGVTSEELIQAIQQVVARARARGIKVYGGYFPPFKDSSRWSAAKQSIQNSVNAWTRTAGVFDGVLDFAAPCVDPDDSERLLTTCDSGDHIHLSTTGSAVIGQAIDLAVLLP
jgi:lysophospholipase L1-like esterase